MEMKFRKSYTQFKLWSNEKIIVISTSKIASRFLDYTFKYSDLDISNEVYIDENMNYKNHGLRDLPNQEKTLQEYEDIITNNTKKDILFLYRNPKKRLVTGISQDFQNQFDKKDINKYILWMVVNKFDKKYDVDTYINFFSGANTKDSNDLLNDSEFKNNIYLLLHAYIIYNLEVDFNLTSHTSNYLYKLNYMVTQLGIDSNKIHLMDIDSSGKKLGSFISNYDDGSMDTNAAIDSNITLKDMVYSVFNEHPSYEKKMDLYLEADVFNYNLLKSHNKNI